MAKGKRDKADKSEATAPQAAGKSLLEVAWRSYQAGDMVTARKAAKLLQVGAPKDADEALAKKLGKEFFAPGHETDARQVAAELASRTLVAPKPLLLAGAAGLIWLVLLAISLRG